MLFQSVITPVLDGKRAYGLYLSSNGCASNDLFAGVINAAVQHRFQQPLACFGIRGIDLGAAGSAGDPLAFVTGLTFNRAGFAQVIQTPITQSVPDSQVPGALPVLGMGAAFGWLRRLQRRITIRIDTTPPQPATLSMGGGRGGGMGADRALFRHQRIHAVSLGPAPLRGAQGLGPALQIPSTATVGSRTPLLDASGGGGG